MKTFTLGRRLAAQALAALLLMAGTASAAELNVMISAGFAEAYAELAPAYDLTFAHNPQGEWTDQHLMSVNGKCQETF